MGSRCVSCSINAGNPDTAPATVNAAIVNRHESDTSLNRRAMLLHVHYVAEGNIGGNLFMFWAAPIHLFPLSLPHPYVRIEESHV